MKMNVREEKLKEITSKLWDFYEKEICEKGYTNQEVLIAWDSVHFAQGIKASRKPENANLLKTIKELLE
jgi:hypothetical protein